MGCIIKKAITKCKAIEIAKSFGLLVHLDTLGYYYRFYVYDTETGMGKYTEYFDKTKFMNEEAYTRLCKSLHSEVVWQPLPLIR